jgi:hypothetical protein
MSIAENVRPDGARASLSPNLTPTAWRCAIVRRFFMPFMLLVTTLALVGEGRSISAWALAIEPRRRTIVAGLIGDRAGPITSCSRWSIQATMVAGAAGIAMRRVASQNSPKQARSLAMALRLAGASASTALRNESSSIAALPGAAIASSRPASRLTGSRAPRGRRAGSAACPAGTTSTTLITPPRANALALFGGFSTFRPAAERARGGDEADVKAFLPQKPAQGTTHSVEYG